MVWCLAKHRDNFTLTLHGDGVQCQHHRLFSENVIARNNHPDLVDIIPISCFGGPSLNLVERLAEIFVVFSLPQKKKKKKKGEKEQEQYLRMHHDYFYVPHIVQKVLLSKTRPQNFYKHSHYIVHSMQIKISIHSLTLHQSNSINLCP
jgi:hypothetical protein